MSCPSPRGLSDAFTAGASPTLAAHLTTCTTCAGSWRELERVVELCRRPAASPSRERADQLRVTLLARAAVRPVAAPSRRRLVAALGLALVAGGLLWWRTRPPAAVAATRHGTVHALPGARYLEVGHAHDEIVRLSEGTLTIEVTPLGPGERYRVATGDAEVEVRGTAFDVVAAADRLTAVRVLHGRVEVRPTGGPTVLLLPGQRWTAPLLAAVAPAAPVPAPALVAPAASSPRRGPASVASRHPPRTLRLVQRAPAAEPARAPAPPPQAPPRVASAAETAFAAGWNQLRAGHAAAAAAAFERALEADPHAPVAEDASFWLGVALARAGHRDRGIAALEAFAEAYAASPRAGEAAVILGWLLVDAGDLAQAEHRFRSALQDPSPRIRDGAQRGLAAATRSQRPRP